ncbi:Acetyl-coenzyme A carboxylase carboxyl transferase subunit beta [Buchnera aphidicola (Neophyllaphis podocarpi)]|uniref:acetyl-CoA carboxylase, carboxyltransferase subunit beta n=1 Tax=Buchnera aphidicola TaxID=9 RepID=UPI003464372D
MNWIKNQKRKKINNLYKSNIPKNLWTKCNSCLNFLYYKELKDNLFVCPICNYHMYISARYRLQKFLDVNSYKEIKINDCSEDFLKFKDLKSYKDRLLFARNKTNENDALVVMYGLLYKIPVVATAFDFYFIGGSMGSIVGSHFILAIKKAIKNECALISFVASGGARMQESFISLMQMSRTTLALSKIKDKHIPYISVLTNPTMGGVSASIGVLGDLNIAEPKSLIGFTGPRVIKQVSNKILPKDFQSSEFLIEKGTIDMIINRIDMRYKLACILSKIMNISIINNKNHE